MLAGSKHQSLVRGVLVRGAGRHPSQRQVFAAFNALCDQLAAPLERLFGATAVDALFARALHLASIEFPALNTVIAKNARRCAIDGPDTAASSVNIQDLQTALAAVLAYHIELLSALVGEDLVMPLVMKAWGSTGTPKTASEGD